jgi:transposase-like protein
MIQRFFDWLTQQPLKQSSFSSDCQPSVAPSNVFSNKPKSMPSLEIDASNIAGILKEHLDCVSDPCTSSQNLQEALTIASHSPSLLSDSQRSSAILSLIGEEDAVFLIRLLRWKDGIVCPFCGSKEIRKLPHHVRQYRCLQCDGGDFHGEFDDLSGYFTKGDFHSARIWVLINYLKMFMPLGKIAKVLGISLEQALRIVSMMQPQALADKKKVSTAPVLKKKEH